MNLVDELLELYLGLSEEDKKRVEIIVDKILEERDAK